MFLPHPTNLQFANLDMILRKMPYFILGYLGYGAFRFMAFWDFAVWTRLQDTEPGTKAMGLVFGLATAYKRARRSS